LLLLRYGGAAEVFAASFYRQISAGMGASGVEVAGALAAARAEVLARIGDPTARAYLFYGDLYFLITATKRTTRYADAALLLLSATTTALKRARLEPAEGVDQG
jgi:hypothetical protein